MDKSTVQSVERTFAIIEALSQEPKGSFLSDLTNITSLNKTTVHRLLKTLIDIGYVIKDGESGRYLLTLKLFEVGGRIVRDHDLLNAARPYIEKLSHTTGEAVHLVIRDRNDIVYILKEDSGNNSVRMSSRVGLRSPMYCTAVGKAILADLPDTEVNDIWNTSEIKSNTNNTITSLAELKKQLAAVSMRGYAIDDEENESGVRCVGASILGFRSKVIGAFSVSAPISRMNDNRMKDIADLVVKTRKEICAVLGNPLNNE